MPKDTYIRIRLTAEQKEQIKEDEYRAAVFACHIREFPYIPDPDRAPCTDQQKAQSGLEAITFIH